MPNLVSDRLDQLSRPWVVLSTLVVFFLFTALVLPAQSSHSQAYTGNAMSPDTSLFYTVEELYNAAESYGAKGRAAYVRSRFTFDLAWPLVYAAFLGTAISWVYQRAFQAGSAWRRANLIPPLAALLDYLENLSTSLVMMLYPTRIFGIAALAPVFTLLKWAMISSSFLLLVLGIVVLLWQRGRRTRR